MRKVLHQNTQVSAYFVREPKLISPINVSREFNTQQSADETPHAARRRLKYKIDRGEYDYSNAVYARKIWDYFVKAEKCVPSKIIERWHKDVLTNFLEKTKQQFIEKFQLESLLQELSNEDGVLYSTEICDYLFRDIKKRAASEPLLELPKFILDEIKSIELACNTNDP